MKIENCWEAMECGRELGGENIGELGICPAAIAYEYNGINRGKFGGRFCWAVTGTFCGGKTQGTYAEKLLGCLNCNFLQKVNDEASQGFILTPKDAERFKQL